MEILQGQWRRRDTRSLCDASEAICVISSAAREPFALKVLFYERGWLMIVMKVGLPRYARDCANLYPHCSIVGPCLGVAYPFSFIRPIRIAACSEAAFPQLETRIQSTGEHCGC